MKPEISIIILNYKQKGLVKQCLRGILSSNISLPFEIIVVDNNSGDDCLEMVHAEFPQVKTITSGKNAGFAYGNNLGIRASEGNTIVILNPDVVCVEGAMEKLNDFLHKNPKAGMVGPALIYPDGTMQYSCRRFPKWYTPVFRRTIFGKFSFAKLELKRYLMMDRERHSPQTVDWLFGACLFIKKSALDKIGVFDERFFLYFEDCDLCRRLWDAGFEVWYYPEVKLVHYHQKLSQQKDGILSIFNPGTRFHIQSAIQYFAKYFKKS